MGNSLNETGGIVGEVTLECFGPDGELKWTEVTHNKITDVGDAYYAQRAIAAVSPNAPADATKVTCMKLGTGVTAESKNGAGAGIVTYVTGTNVVFDAGSPSRSANVVTYVTTFVAGVGTATLGEIVIAVTNANSTSVAADCISRALISPTRVKAAGDSLVATWTHTFLGA